MFLNAKAANAIILLLAAVGALGGVAIAWLLAMRFPTQPRPSWRDALVGTATLLALQLLNAALSYDLFWVNDPSNRVRELYESHEGLGTILLFCAAVLGLRALLFRRPISR